MLLPVNDTNDLRYLLFRKRSVHAHPNPAIHQRIPRRSHEHVGHDAIGPFAPRSQRGYQLSLRQHQPGQRQAARAAQRLRSDHLIDRPTLRHLRSDRSSTHLAHDLDHSILSDLPPAPSDSGLLRTHSYHRCPFRKNLQSATFPPPGAATPDGPQDVPNSLRPVNAHRLNRGSPLATLLQKHGRLTPVDPGQPRRRLQTRRSTRFLKVADRRYRVARSLCNLLDRQPGPSPCRTRCTHASPPSYANGSVSAG